ncbi:type VI secretion system tip protein VgrG, partial [Xenorhabdus bovienii]
MGHKEKYQYGTHGNLRLCQLTDALKQQTHYRYSNDHASLNGGSLTDVELPDGTTQQLAYDSERRVVAVTDGEGRTTRYTYGAFDLLNQVIDFPAVLDRTATLTILQNGIEQRSITGIVSRFEQGNTGLHQTTYQMTIRPDLWRTTLRQNSRIFQ